MNFFGRTFNVIIGASLLTGLIVTTMWFFGYRESLPAIDLLSVVSAFLIIVVGTLFNLGIRWLRWHYLVRRLTKNLVSKDSLKLYFATLPAILTPFYIGELIRYYFLKDKLPASFADFVLIWLLERVCDVIILSLFFMFASENVIMGLIIFGCVLLVMGVFGSTQTPERKRTPLLRIGVITTCLAGTFLAWAALMVFAGLAMKLIAPTLSFHGLIESFTGGSIAGGVTGVPGGLGVTGSVSILYLKDFGLESGLAILVIALLRAGTTWFSVALGFVVFAVFRRDILSAHRQQVQGHFDELAPEYDDNIPIHIRERLLKRKTEMLNAVLTDHFSDSKLRGLDFGCGQGWYAQEMSGHGMEVHGVDLSSSQVKMARDHATASGADVHYCSYNGSQLPYRDSVFDFVYCINVIHHIVDPQTRGTVLNEIQRVLKKDGLFIMHEINTDNVIFRLYMSYLFPVLKDIDEGTESWISPQALPEIDGIEWLQKTQYYTFLPDFFPAFLLNRAIKFEQMLERGPLRRWSAHYMAIARKETD